MNNNYANTRRYEQPALATVAWTSTWTARTTSYLYEHLLLTLAASTL